MQSRQNRATPSLSLEDTVENEAVVVDGEEDYGNDIFNPETRRQIKRKSNAKSQKTLEKGGDPSPKKTMSRRKTRDKIQRGSSNTSQESNTPT